MKHLRWTNGGERDGDLAAAAAAAGGRAASLRASTLTNLAKERDVRNEGRVHDDGHVPGVEQFDRIRRLLTAVLLELDLEEVVAMRGNTRRSGRWVFEPRPLAVELVVVNFWRISPTGSSTRHPWKKTMQPKTTTVIITFHRLGRLPRVNASFSARALSDLRRKVGGKGVGKRSRKCSVDSRRVTRSRSAGTCKNERFDDGRASGRRAGLLYSGSD